ncbi:methyltransferase [Couchioplanes caeruleus]|uniref:O-methyltransferase n=2 Tax=Couchioplanes caeruleus TaxID=56438 RepID=A0A1K0FU42_9ACTN|nr:methyltransferase [Couchioplanes caeruleus]OJF16216.1 O-methyltransferase [Couchioplanes caeruleus subsp. caeruleus]ROP28767.1 hydroxyneurosporene-O-methyltransferase [Couchioplanes caeruleus]
MTSPSAPTTSAAQTLARLLVGNQLQQAVHVAARLGLADQLRDGPRMSAELAKVVGAHPDALHRLLRALAGHGIVAADDEQRFSLTPLGELLRSDDPRSVLPFALWSGGVSYQAFGALEHSVRTGEPAFEHLFGQEFFGYLAEHPESGAVFDEMMSRHTAPVAGAIAGHDLAGVEVVVDVGGGHGELLAAILHARPGVRGVLVEQPRVLDEARRVFARAGVADRCEAVAGDIHRPLPPGDVYVLKSVLHGLSDEEAAEVLANCRRTLRPGGRLLVVEFVLPPDNAPSPGLLMDLLMLVGCHGRERTAADFADLFRTAGLRLAGITSTKHGYSLIEGREPERC